MKNTAEDHSIIFKIFRRSEWQDALNNKDWAGSSDDIRDGFIHFSLHHQVRKTLGKFFQGEKNLVIAAYHTDAFPTDTLRFEALTGSDMYPHLYDHFDAGDPVRVWEIQDADCLPADFEGHPYD